MFGRNLAPSVETLKLGQSAETPVQWRLFTKRYRSEMAAPSATHDIELLAALSHHANFSVGCHCEHEERCHRSVLRPLLQDKGARLSPQGEVA